MQITIESALAIYNTLNELRNNNVLKFGLAWLIDDNLKALSTHVDRAQNEHDQLLNKYGTLIDEVQKKYNIESENIEVYQKDWQKVTSHKIDIELKEISFSDLENLSITAGASIKHLEPLIKKSIEQ